MALDTNNAFNDDFECPAHSYGVLGLKYRLSASLGGISWFALSKNFLVLLSPSLGYFFSLLAPAQLVIHVMQLSLR